MDAASLGQRLVIARGGARRALPPSASVLPPRPQHRPTRPDRTPALRITTRAPLSHRTGPGPCCTFSVTTIPRPNLSLRTTDQPPTSISCPAARPRRHQLQHEQGACSLRAWWEPEQTGGKCRKGEKKGPAPDKGRQASLCSQGWHGIEASPDVRGVIPGVLGQFHSTCSAGFIQGWN